jgi:hypothetical protein
MRAQSFVLKACAWSFLAATLALSACKGGGATPPDGGTTLPDGGDGGAGAGVGDGGVVTDDGGVPGMDAGVVDDNPTSPKDDSGGDLAWPDAPLLDGVMVAPNRDSAVIVAPPIAGAADYRVFGIPAGVSVETDASGHETVTGTTIFCAGFRQHNAPAGMPELLRQVEVAGLSGETRLVVEAIDTTCPFAGILGAAHADVDAENPEIDPADRGVFSVYTEAEIRKTYGSLVVNGHAPGAHVGSPAPPAPPRVLARTTLKVTPVGYGSKPTTFFEDFAVADQPAFVDMLPNFDRTQQGKLYQNGRFSFYTYGADLAQFFVDRGRLHTILADWSQDIMSSNVVYPRQPVALSATDYLHVTFEVATDATQRRYWWLLLCGAEQPGATMDAEGRLLGNIIQTPFFYQPDGLDPSIEGWNCLQVFPRDGAPYPLPPADTAPESDVRVMVNLPNKPIRDNVINVSPPMYPDVLDTPSWYRQREGAGNLVAPILDDQMLIAPATHYDVYIRRDRVVVFVNGAPRLCNDFPSVALTMAEGALGFGQVLYHSAAERLEFSASYWPRTGQRYYLTNTPFLDARAWDNLGYTEHVAAPPAFDATSCFVYGP